MAKTGQEAPPGVPLCPRRLPQWTVHWDVILETPVRFPLGEYGTVEPDSRTKNKEETVPWFKPQPSPWVEDPRRHTSLMFQSRPLCFTR